MSITVATIILPLYDNDNVPTVTIRAFCERKILKAFGGFTAYKAHGAWINDKGVPVCEDVCKYDIAADWSSERNRDILCQIAQAFAVDAAQDCVYVGFPDDVRFVIPKGTKHPA